MRKEKQYHFIYKTTNLLNGKYYIGMHSTDKLDDGYLGSGRRLRYSINKYGKENHKREILEFCKTRKELKSREQEIVNLNEIAKTECLNMVVGGQGGFVDFNHMMKWSTRGHRAYWNDPINGEFNKQRQSNLLKKLHRNNILFPNGIVKENNPFYGKIHSTETKKKMSESSKGMGKGNTNSQYGSRWITNEIINKKIKKEDIIPDGFTLGRI